MYSAIILNSIYFYFAKNCISLNASQKVTTYTSLGAKHHYITAYYTANNFQCCFTFTPPHHTLTPSRSIYYLRVPFGMLKHLTTLVHVYKCMHAATIVQNKCIYFCHLSPIRIVYTYSAFPMYHFYF